MALNLCLDNPANGSTSAQTRCEVQAESAYDRRMNAAYGALLRTLPRRAAGELRNAQRTWLAFRDAQRMADAALFATRQGTMYVPMQGGSATRVVRDRALQLEASLRILQIEAQ
ncbi:lysozyme inhibitor LprI family protein [Sphingomonas sp. S2-65]|uniref:lysozyme inhibitor LprI family protein n=1 Tax=Sphingomonas sp. S2-65 TaxID=2903960 RepID=UPI001F373B21|nr:lysozyme inhibitor LprI family protein [Sphingomonas sp. S2-65]UYY58426.1 lysozyme inhibitor LprI family protein [Sphingomonas sp. S2-65]